MSFTELTSKDDFEKAIKTEGKYVIIYIYEGDMPPQAEE
jgi:thioredoxin 1